MFVFKSLFNYKYLLSFIKYLYRNRILMKTIILSESQVKNVIGRILSEQNEIKTESATVNFDAVWSMGKWKLTSQQSGPIIQKLIQITDFINNHKGSVITIQIEAGESQVTNYDAEDPAKPILAPGVLSQRRGDSMVRFLTQYFQGLVDKGAIDKMPELPKPITKIGSTPYKKGSTDLKDKQAQYQQEQFVRAIITTKKDYECLVGMEITIGYYPGQSKAQHQCDEAIFELRMNGVSLGEVNLNNSILDVGLSRFYALADRAKLLYQKNYKKAEQMWERDVKNGTITKPTDEKKVQYISDYAGEEPQGPEFPSWVESKATKLGYESAKMFSDSITKVNEAFKSYGRKSDGATAGARSQTFILNGEKAKSIIDQAPSDKIVLSIVPLVSKNGKYKMFYEKGSHADTPWVTIKSKKSENPLFNGEPNVGMQRGSTKETILLQTDLCGNPVKAVK